MMTVAQVKRSAMDAKRTSDRITAEALTRPSSLRAWLRQIMRLEADIRRYAKEHGVRDEDLRA